MQKLARCNIGVGTCLVGMVICRFAPAAASQPADAEVERESPVWCSLISRIAPVLVSSGVPLPQAFDVTEGTIGSDRAAAFQLYAVGSSPEFHWFLNHEARGLGPDSPVHVRVRAAQRSHDVSGRVFHAISGNQDPIVYVPRRPYRKDRTALLTFQYTCGHHRRTFRSTFRLNISGAPPASGQEPQRSGDEP